MINLEFFRDIFDGFTDDLEISDYCMLALDIIIEGILSVFCEFEDQVTCVTHME